MTYSLRSEDDQVEAQLSNCFASTYALLESVDMLTYNFHTLTQELATVKWFDIAVLDQIHILGDTTVLYE